MNIALFIFLAVALASVIGIIIYFSSRKPDPTPKPDQCGLFEKILDGESAKYGCQANGDNFKACVNERLRPTYSCENLVKCYQNGEESCLTARDALDTESSACARKECGVFTVVLKSFPAENKIKVLKEVRAITGLGLREAKEFIEAAPIKLPLTYGIVEATEVKNKLLEAGAVVEILS